MMFTVRRARSEDLEAITKLLRSAGTNEQGVDEHVHHFLVIEDPSVQPPRFVGTAGLERYGEKGLLRSFVMESDSWNAKVGLELIQVVLGHAHQAGLQEVYLLAGIAHNIFEHLGFIRVDWRELPEGIRQSDHLRQMEGKNTVPMMYRYTEEGRGEKKKE